MRQQQLTGRAHAVTYNGKVIYSKLASNKFPEGKEIVAALKGAGLKAQ